MRKFFISAGSARNSIYQEAVALGDKAGTASKHYLRVMEKLVNGAEGYLEKESKRYVKRHFYTQQGNSDDPELTCPNQACVDTRETWPLFRQIG